ncbi:MAG: HD domain-containing protein [Actinomycetota bacterium]
MIDDRVRRQIGFILEADRLKGVERRCWLTDGSRRETSAEHSWHLALMAIVLAEHAAEPVDVLRVLQLVVVHDLVEIDAGDTFLYDDAGRTTKDERERQAADRLFAMLPPPQGAQVRDLWDEYTSRSTPEARFAKALDRLAPLLLNHATHGGGWSDHGITAEQVRSRNPSVAEASPVLQEVVEHLIADSVAQGFLPP